MLNRTSRHPSQPFCVVIETNDPSLAIADFVSFGSAGFDVVCCSGPTPDKPCSALEGRECPWVRDADVVVNQLTDARVQMEVIKGVRRTSPQVPMVVGGAAAFDEDLPEGCVALANTTSVNGQINLVRRAAIQTRAGAQ